MQNNKVNKTKLTEADIITKFILPSIKNAGWDDMTQIRQEVKLRDGKVIVRGQMGMRQAVKSADIVLYHKPNQPLAVIEAKANKHDIAKGIQQGLDYANLLEVPFIFASNGDGYIFHDKTNPLKLETKIGLDNFPTHQELWLKYCKYKGYKKEDLDIITQDYYYGDGKKSPRYYQLQAINKTIEAVAKGKDRILLVMATGTGKTYTAFQIIWRLWRAKAKKRILFLADRNILVDQTKTNDFEPFGQAMTKIKGRKVDPAYEIHLALYQALTGPEEYQKAFKQVDPNFFDLIIIDECHRGSAADDSAWREILEYFKSATQVGLTATPKETNEVSNIDYFGKPTYSYTLKQGINDGFLAPYKVVRVDIDVDLQGWRPRKKQIDKNGELIDDRIYNQKDFDRTLIIDERTELVAKTITSYLKRTDQMAKTIVFCEDIDHAQRMRMALVNLNPKQITKNEKYVMKITGDDEIGKAQLDNFISPKKTYPVIATTSELMTTGVDAKTCKLVVIDQNIKSMTKFKQIIGRGTRIDSRFGKLWFTILDFKKATELFADADFDGEPVQVMDKKPQDIISPVIDLDSELDQNQLNENQLLDETTNPEDQSHEQLQNENLDWGEIGDNEKLSFTKYHVSGVVVKKMAQRVQYCDSDGSLVTESFKDYTCKKMHEKYTSLDEFIKSWNAAERKQTIIDELAQAGIIWEALEQDVEKDLDPFDIICHLVYDKPALTRSERANRVKKQNYFTKYSKIAKKVLDNLLIKYADVGIQEIENMQVLKIEPFIKLGSMSEIIKKGFGNKHKYQQAIKELTDKIYQPEPDPDPDPKPQPKQKLA